MATIDGRACAWDAFRPSFAARVLIAACRFSILGRGRARKAMLAAFRHLHGPYPVDCYIWGSPARLHPANNNADRKALMAPGRFNASELAVVRRALVRPGAVFVDVGANSGLYSLYAALHAARDCRIIAIEPAGDVLARLAFNVELARRSGFIDPRVEVVSLNVAAGDVDGEALLSLAGQEGARSLCDGTGELVPVRSLATLLDGCGVSRIDVLKIDVEGYEDRVLLPYFASTPPERWPRIIVMEHACADGWRTDCLAACERRGYARVLTTRNNVVLAATCTCQ